MSAPAQARRRLHPALIAVAALAGIGIVAFLWWTISPLFISSRVDEAFPTSAAVAPTAAPAAVIEPTAVPVSEPAAAAEIAAMPVAEAVPTAAPAAAAPVTVSEPAAEVVPTAAPQPTAAPAEPVALAAGSFTRIDSLHAAEGSATIYRLPDGQLILRFENFASLNGPDLFVGLSGHPMPRSSAEVHENYVELARLTANQGNQNYTLPADLDLSSFKSVVIYCKAFSVVFSTAELLDA